MSAEPQSGLARIDVDAVRSPFQLYEAWLEEATQRGAATPLVYNMATATSHGHVTNRTVAVTDYVDGSFVTLLTRRGRKFEALAENPSVAATFYWCYADAEGRHVMRQVRAEGRLEELDEATGRRYFEAKPLFARIRSVICAQGEPVDWDELKRRHDDLLRDVEEGAAQLEKPEHEVACRIVPERFEFYYAYDNFIADRILAELVDGQWKMKRIAT